MTLYTKLQCPLCHVVKLKMDLAEIPYTECMDEKEMEKLKIDQLPVLILDDGTKLGFKEIIDYLKEEKDK